MNHILHSNNPNGLYMTFARPYHPETIAVLANQVNEVSQYLSTQGIGISNVHVCITSSDSNIMWFDSNDSFHKISRAMAAAPIPIIHVHLQYDETTLRFQLEYVC